MTDLGTLGGARGILRRASTISARSSASRRRPAGLAHPFLYSGGVMTDLGTLGGTRGYALGINDLGQVVGYASTASGAFDAFIDCQWHDAGLEFPGQQR